MAKPDREIKLEAAESSQSASKLTDAEKTLSSLIRNLLETNKENIFYIIGQIENTLKLKNMTPEDLLHQIESQKITQDEVKIQLAHLAPYKFLEKRKLLNLSILAAKTQAKLKNHLKNIQELEQVIASFKQNYNDFLAYQTLSRENIIMLLEKVTLIQQAAQQANVSGESIQALSESIKNILRKLENQIVRREETALSEDQQKFYQRPRYGAVMSGIDTFYLNSRKDIKNTFFAQRELKKLIEKEPLIQKVKAKVSELQDDHQQLEQQIRDAVDSLQQKNNQLTEIKAQHNFSSITRGKNKLTEKLQTINVKLKQTIEIETGEYRQVEDPVEHCVAWNCSGCSNCYKEQNPTYHSEPIYKTVPAYSGEDRDKLIQEQTSLDTEIKTIDTQLTAYTDAAAPLAAEIKGIDSNISSLKEHHNKEKKTMTKLNELLIQYQCLQDSLLGEGEEEHNPKEIASAIENFNANLDTATQLLSDELSTHTALHM